MRPSNRTGSFFNKFGDLGRNGYLYGGFAKLQYLSATPGLLQKICPILHHLGAGLQVQRVVIGSTHCVTWSMGQLQFDVRVIVALFVEDGGSDAPKPVAGHSALVAHPFQRLEDGVVAHWLLRVAISGEEQLATTR